MIKWLIQIASMCNFINQIHRVLENLNQFMIEIDWIFFLLNFNKERRIEEIFDPVIR